MFGKLPATGDFIRYNATTDELTAFDKWLGAGINFARQSMGPTFDSAYQPAVGLFIYRGEAANNEPPQRGMVGAWRPASRMSSKSSAGNVAVSS